MDGNDHESGKEWGRRGDQKIWLQTDKYIKKFGNMMGEGELIS